MNREIKFRAWVIGRDRDIYGTLNGDNRMIETTDLERKWEFPLMQYTGLKDKNGKEIYEGDIVKITSGGYSNKEVVKFDFGCFYAGWHSGSSTKERPKLILQRYTEIIGNIYETPELLNN